MKNAILKIALENRLSLYEKIKICYTTISYDIEMNFLKSSMNCNKM